MDLDNGFTSFSDSIKSPFVMINIQELSVLREYKYLHLSDKIGKGEANLDGNWLYYNGSLSCERVNFDEYILELGTTIYGDDNLIYQKDGTLFIKEANRDQFNSNGDVVGYLFNIENKWRLIKKEGDKNSPYDTWRKEWNQLILFVMFCILTIGGGCYTLLLGVVSSIIVGVTGWIIGDIILYYRYKDYIREYIKTHEHDDYSQILIHDYLTNEDVNFLEVCKKIFYIGL
jgi:hypothetical protein